MYHKLGPLQLYSSMICDNVINLWNYHNDQNLVYSTPSLWNTQFLRCFGNILLPPYLELAMACFLSLYTNLHYLHNFVPGILHWAWFWDEVVLISNFWFLLVAKKYPIEIHNTFYSSTYILMENQIVSLLTIVNFAAIIFRYLFFFVCGYIFSFLLCKYVGVESWII